MSEVVEETYYEGLWDCPNCETTNKGSMMKCQGCGGTRDEDVKFYMPDDAAEITDEAGLAAAKGGADWVCGYCSVSNTAGDSSCKSCGAGQEDGEARRQEVIEETGGNPPPPRPAPKKAPAGSNNMLFAIIGIVAVVAAGGLFMLFGKSTESAKVAKVFWERSITVEYPEWKTVIDSPTLPNSMGVGGGTRVVRETKGFKLLNVREGMVPRMVEETVMVEKTTTKKVNLGNGRFKKEKITKKVPVKKKIKKMVPGKLYTYKIRKWLRRAPKVATGPPDEPMRWPDVRKGPMERERRQESYVVVFETKSGEMPELRGPDGEFAPKSIDDLKQWQIGDTRVVTYNKAQGVTKVENP